MSRVMQDALIAANIPTSAGMVGGYVDGRAWSANDWDRFPNAIKVTISAINTNAGVVNDMERGNGNATQVFQWLIARRAAGVDPTVYCAPGYRSGYGQQDLIDICDANGEQHPWWWLADATGSPHMATGPRVVATQWAVDAQLGVGYDLSMVADYWSGVDSGPSPAPVKRRASLLLFT